MNESDPGYDLDPKKNLFTKFATKKINGDLNSIKNVHFFNSPVEDDRSYFLILGKNNLEKEFNFYNFYTISV